MYLTDNRNGIIRELDDHEELEVLLESFSKQVEEIVNEAENIDVTCHILSVIKVLINNIIAEQCSIHARNCRTNLRLES